MSDEGGAQMRRKYGRNVRTACLGICIGARISAEYLSKMIVELGEFVNLCPTTAPKLKCGGDIVGVVGICKILYYPIDGYSQQRLCSSCTLLQFIWKRHSLKVERGDLMAGVCGVQQG